MANDQPYGTPADDSHYRSDRKGEPEQKDLEGAQRHVEQLSGASHLHALLEANGFSDTLSVEQRISLTDLMARQGLERTDLGAALHEQGIRGAIADAAEYSTSGNLYEALEGVIGSYKPGTRGYQSQPPE